MAQQGHPPDQQIFGIKSAIYARGTGAFSYQKESPTAQRYSSTVARASIARPSPTGPSFSAVLAFTLT